MAINHKDQDRIDAYNVMASKIREEINSRPLTDFYKLTRSKRAGRGMYDCPICGSGTGAKGTGALSIRKSDNQVTCFANGCFGNGSHQGSDTLGALRKIYPEKTEKDIFEMCGYRMNDTRIENNSQVQRKTDTPKQKTRSVDEIRAEISRFEKDLPGSDGEAYLIGRGLSPETMRRLHMGYDKSKKLIVLPHNKSLTYYSTRSIVKDSIYKHGKLAGIEQPIFNDPALYKNDGICFVTEAPLCAASIIQAGGQAVALDGVGYGALLSMLDKKTTDAIIALCLDNDEAGKNAMYGSGGNAGLAAELEKRGIKCISVVKAVMGEADPAAHGYCKDPNDVLQMYGPEEFKKIIQETIDEIKAEQKKIEAAADAERQERSGAEAIDTFLQAVQTRRYEPIPTGIKDLDWAIGGGFIRQQLVLLGAAPGAGKTALAQWLFEGMAKRQEANIIFLNLEMSREQILARSFSRMAADRGEKITSTTVLQGYRWTDEQRRIIYEVSDEYKRTIVPNLAYNPDGVGADLDSIITHIEDEAKRFEKEGKMAPVVCIDYLQIIRGREREDDSEMIKRAVKAFKDYAVAHNTIVFVIMAHNRASNKSGTLSQESGRDTSALEYSADLQLGLTFTRLLKRDGFDQKGSRDQLTEDEKHLLTLKVLKGRFGGEGTEVDLYFDGKTMSYRPIRYDDVLTRTNEPTPFDE